MTGNLNIVKKQASRHTFIVSKIHHQLEELTVFKERFIHLKSTHDRKPKRQFLVDNEKR